MAIHTLAVLVENSPGVLARVASLFSRRGYNIDSLAVGPTENPKVSRMTIVLNLEGHALDQVSAQLFKLVNVIGISEMKDVDSLKREILLVKVANKAATKEMQKNIMYLSQMKLTQRFLSRRLALLLQSRLYLLS